MKLRVLIAEDDDELRQNMVMLLSKEFQIVAAVTNKELVQVAACLLPDVIVSDVSTPRMEGMTARKKLNAEGKSIPFVFVSRDSQQGINVLWKETSLAFVRRNEIATHLANAVEAVHSLAIYDSPFYPRYFDGHPEDQNIVLVEEETLRRAEQMVLSCEACNKSAEFPFCEILDRLTGSDATVTDYILQKPGTCPRCFRAITEKTFIELNGWR
jgi:CheY-like chemotaxis protein